MLDDSALRLQIKSARVSWREAKRRCMTATCKDYKYYGARGIRFCDHWMEFANFLADMGPRPPGTTLGRIDNNGNYEPGNCSWATAIEQNRNSRHCKLTHDDAQEILGRVEHGEPHSSVAARMGVTTAHIGMIVTGKTWKELAPPRIPEHRLRAHRFQLRSVLTEHDVERIARRVVELLRNSE